MQLCKRKMRFGRYLVRTVDSSNSDSTPVRLYYLDVVRAGLMLLGVPYHTARAYSDEGWPVKSPDRSDLLMILDHGIHLFRLPSFFIIAGYFAALLLSRRSPSTWLKSRLCRLGIPLIAASCLLNPLEPVFHHIALIVSSKESLTVASHAIFRKASIFYPRVHHLWFLIVLIYYSVAAAAIVKLTPTKWKWSYLDFVERTRAPWLLIIVSCCLIGFYQMLTYSLLLHIGRIVGSKFEVFKIELGIFYTPYFIFGFILARLPAANEIFLRLHPLILISAVASLSFALTLYDTDALGLQTKAIAQLFSAVPALLVAQALLSLAKRYSDKPMRGVDALVGASFVIYLFHQPLVIFFNELFLMVDAPVLLEFAVTTLSVTAISYAIWLIVRRSKVLNVLFNGTWPTREMKHAWPVPGDDRIPILRI